jgi:hypothetical protein
LISHLLQKSTPSRPLLTRSCEGTKCHTEVTMSYVWTDLPSVFHCLKCLFCLNSSCFNTWTLLQLAHTYLCVFRALGKANYNLFVN